MEFPKEIIMRYEVDAKGTTVKAMDGGELIRCKDCVHYQRWITGMYCTVHDWRSKKNDYCSRAEKLK